jgi:putative transposase
MPCYARVAAGDCCPRPFHLGRTVYKAFGRWAAAGVFEAMHDRLRPQWRCRMGKAPEPTAAISEAQSPRSTAQGGDIGFDPSKTYPA